MVLSGIVHFISDNQTGTVNVTVLECVDGSDIGHEYQGTISDGCLTFCDRRVIMRVAIFVIENMTRVKYGFAVYRII